MLLGDKVIRWVDASLAAPAAVVEQEALEVAVSHLSPKGSKERKKDALATQQARWRRQDYFAHRRRSFVRDGIWCLAGWSLEAGVLRRQRTRGSTGSIGHCSRVMTASRGEHNSLSIAVLPTI